MDRNRRSVVSPVLVRVAAVALAALTLAGCNTQAQDGSEPPAPPQVSAAEVVVREVQLWDTFTGRIEAVETVALRPRVDGYIERINYDEGQEVERGDVLFVIDARPYRAELSRAEAEHARALARAELARTEAERAEKLAGSSAISAEELDQRRAAAAEAQAAVHAARASVEIARLQLEFTEVRAPIAGRAGRARVTVGNLVSGQGNGTPLTTIVSLDRVHVHFHSDEQAYQRYDAMARSGERPSSRDNGTPVRVGLAIEPGYPHQGRVDFVDNRINPDTGTILMRAVIDNRERRFVPGMFARVQMPGSGSFTALLVDDKAILTDQDRKYVYVVDGDGHAVRKDVVPGRLVDGLRVITDGLAPGDRVVISGTQRIFFPGMPVDAEIVSMDAATGATAAASPP
ncbi:efflux RND transporter periplasmic adaptor subunit [Aquisalimonas lutea]|uniref:efflux RND transporter periplasmic adaptor subunit n=1 Tax=Aquisalimonas lutea TaxID=1327750 RepID=UPI0025B49CE5|nr:efflux RND transporter periplasmic adaptor subunit [Aquisalimonas lutea]MDN3517577.1 efflux RND transporter periplasmic adaptor subunit [Aquisalimonas lutea]